MNNIDINIEESKRTVIHWENHVKQIIDGYRSYTKIYHALQKDAIQNSWDARVNKTNANNWKIIFELIESKNQNYFVFTDYGTTGLTGKVLTIEELDKDLPIVERWGRFENVAFTKEPSENALGARGRGKFVFVGSSQFEAKTLDNKKISSLILYDTFRSDGVYRLGYRTIIKTDSPIQSFDGEEAKNKLKKLTYDTFSPLNTIGTRVIIVDPIEEIISSFKNGDFLEAIEETWWEIIKNQKANIYIETGGNKTRAKINKYYNIPDKDNNRYKVTKKHDLKLPNAPIYKATEFKIAFDSQNKVPKSIKGIAIQRGGMKVCTIPVKYIDKKLADNIFGYIKLDNELEKNIQKDEGIEHYSFDFTKKLPNYLRQLIEDEISIFLREKLGIQENKPKEYSEDISAEKKALYLINKIANNYGILGKNISKSGSGGGGGGSILTDKKSLFLRFDSLIFPNDSLRVNYGQSIKDISLLIINSTLKANKVAVNFSIIYDDNEEIINFIQKQYYEIGANSNRNISTVPELKIENNIFRFKGKYSFKTVLVSMEPNEEGNILHKLTKHFWVEENPPQKGVFDDIDAIDLPNEQKDIMGFAERIENSSSYKFYYNRKHPAKISVEKNENRLTKYLIELMAHELAWIDLRNPVHKIFKEEDFESQERLVRRLSIFLGQVKYLIYYGDNN